MKKRAKGISHGHLLQHRQLARADAERHTGLRVAVKRRRPAGIGEGTCAHEDAKRQE
jgi:hypothetical protein